MSASGKDSRRLTSQTSPAPSWRRSTPQTAPVTRSLLLHPAVPVAVGLALFVGSRLALDEGCPDSSVGSEPHALGASMAMAATTPNASLPIGKVHRSRQCGATETGLRPTPRCRGLRRRHVQLPDRGRSGRSGCDTFASVRRTHRGRSGCSGRHSECTLPGVCLVALLLLDGCDP
jgi:hypothetical protein